MCNSNTYLQKKSITHVSFKQIFTPIGGKNHDNLKKCFQTKCMGNSLFQICSESTQNHLGHGKTLPNPTN